MGMRRGRFEPLDKFHEESGTEEETDEEETDDEGLELGDIEECPICGCEVHPCVRPQINHTVRAVAKLVEGLDV